MSLLRLTTALLMMVVSSHGLALYNTPHEADGKHNAHYDHELFLGKEEAEQFDQLTEAESKRRLGMLVDRIDKDENGHVTEAELKDWIWYVRISFVVNDSDQFWAHHKPEDGALSWDAYLRQQYGSDDENYENPHSQLYHARDRIQIDQRRWKAADINNDTKLTKTEFTYFIHPEEGRHTKDVLVLETIETLDKDKDGYINLDEFIMHNEMAHRSQDPQWLDKKQNEFKNSRDKNKDGKMDFEEAKEWINPSNYDHSQAEAKHLIHMADSDKDGILSKEEIISHHNLFAGSQATDYGEVLKKHDEF